MTTVKEIISELKIRADEPETVRSLVFELQAALTADIPGLLALLLDSCRGNNGADAVAVINKLDGHPGLLNRGEPALMRQNQRVWRNVKEFVLLAADHSFLPDAVWYVETLQTMVSNDWKPDATRICLARRTSCDNCKERIPGDDFCPICGHHRDLCKNQAIEGNTACRFHMTRRTPAEEIIFKNPSSVFYRLRDGDFRELFEAALESKDMLANTDSIALFMARMGHLMKVWEEFDGEDVSYSIGRVKTLKAALEYAVREDEEPDQERIVRIAKALLGAVEIVEGDRRLWEDMRNTAYLLDKLRGSERQRIVAAHSTLSIEEAMAMMEALASGFLDAVDRYITDHKQRNEILLHMNKMLSGKEVRLPVFASS